MASSTRGERPEPAAGPDRGEGASQSRGLKALSPPVGLSEAGRALWAETNAAHRLSPSELVVLEEVCRAKDRLDILDDELIRDGSKTWREIGPHRLQVSDPSRMANATADVMKQLIAALRLPDPRTGRRPQRRGPRGAYLPVVPHARKTRRH